MNTMTSDQKRKNVDKQDDTVMSITFLNNWILRAVY